MNDKVVLTTAYLPPIQYFTKLIDYATILIEKYENYIKQSYRNRCNILGANGILPLSIPIQHNYNQKVLIKDVRIDYSIQWQKLHYQSIQSAYGSSAYYEFYIDELLPFYKKKYKYLFDFNFEIQATLCQLLNINKKIEVTTHYKKEYEEINDFRYSIHPKRIKQVKDNNFSPQSYYQVFEEKFNFTPNLSIIDLLFNMGNEAKEVLQNSLTK